MDADVFRNMYDDVSKIVDEHGAEAVIMKVLRNRLEDLYDTDLTSEDLALLDQMIQKKFNDPETQRVLAERINTPERTLVVNAGGGSTALEVPHEATGMAEEHEAPVAQQVVLPVATAAPVPNANLERLGVVDGERKFGSSVEAKDWVKINLFLANQGKGKGCAYTLFTCKGCAFRVRMRGDEGEEVHVCFPEGNSWHASECPRVAKGVHGLTKGLRAAAATTAPRTLVENECKRVLAEQGVTGPVTAPTEVRPEIHLQVPVSRRFNSVEN